jgi:hypothetical protein
MLSTCFQIVAVAEKELDAISLGFRLGCEVGLILLQRGNQLDGGKVEDLVLLAIKLHVGSQDIALNAWFSDSKQLLRCLLILGECHIHEYSEHAGVKSLIVVV